MNSRSRYAKEDRSIRRAEAPSADDALSELSVSGTDHQIHSSNRCLHEQNPQERRVDYTRVASALPPRTAEKYARSSPTQHLDDPAQNSEPTNRTISTKIRSNNRRRQRRRTRARGGPRIFRRGKCDYLRASLEPKPWQPALRLTDDRNKNDDRRWPSTARTADGSSARSFSQNEAARAVLRRGPRYNPAEYNPQNRDLPRESDESPGPKYGRTPGAFGRTGAGGGVVAPSATLFALKRDGAWR